MIKSINVMIVYVEDQDTVRNFFTDKLGFETVTDAEMWPGARWIEVKPPGAETGLAVLKAVDFGSEPDKGYPGTFACDDLESTRTAYAANGVTVGEINNEAWGSYFQVTDPEGREFLVNDRH